MTNKPEILPEKSSWKLHLSTSDVALVSLFAALYVVLGTLPLFYIFGSYGTFITAALILAPIAGIVLGPVGGTVSVIVGGIAGMAITGNMPMGVFSFLPGALNALCIGLVFRGKWYFSAAIFAAFIIGFIALPSIDTAKWVIWFDAFALFVLISPASTIARKYVKNKDPQKIVLGVGILTFIGVLVDHAVGSLIFQALTPLPTEVWEGLALVYPIERLLVTIVATIIGAGVIKAMSTSGLKIGQALA